MKKSILISVVLLIILAIATSVYAYESNDYTVDVPSDYTERMTATFAKDNGNSFNIQITKFDEKSGYPYTQANLDKLAEELNQTNGVTINKKEITNCTKNNYKCMHIESVYTGVNCDQYAIVSGDKIYTLTLGSLNKDDLSSAEMKGIVDSFTLKDYKEPKNGISPILIGAIVGAAVGAVMGIISAIKNKKGKAVNTESTENTTNTENKDE